MQSKTEQALKEDEVAVLKFDDNPSLPSSRNLIGPCEGGGSRQKKSAFFFFSFDITAAQYLQFPLISLQTNVERCHNGCCADC